MNIHGKFLTTTKAHLLQWATTHMGEYREADNRDEFCMETLDEFVEETFNDDHDSWYDFSPQTLTIDDIKAGRRHSPTPSSRFIRSRGHPDARV
jgi:hypothetical protein